ncbi:MAG: hypothetical protein JXA98_08400 [Methanosarcinaceae archaeon]|nr:hypothetical protein [Methanosarcinaceae archaeon]
MKENDGEFWKYFLNHKMFFIFVIMIVPILITPAAALSLEAFSDKSVCGVDEKINFTVRVTPGETSITMRYTKAPSFTGENFDLKFITTSPTDSSGILRETHAYKTPGSYEITWSATTDYWDSQTQRTIKGENVQTTTSFTVVDKIPEEKEEIIEDKTVTLTLEHIPPVFGKDIQNGGKIIATLLDENNKPMPYKSILIEPDTGIADVFENDYSYVNALSIRNTQKYLGITENDKAVIIATDDKGKATWHYYDRIGIPDLYLDSPELGKLLFEKAKAKKPVELEGTIRAWYYELEATGGRYTGGEKLATATTPVKFTHIAEISSIGSTDSSQPPKVRAMRIDLDSWQSFFRAIGVSKSWSDIIKGSKQVLPGDCPYKLIPGDTILLDENDIITVKWMNGYEMVIKTKAGFLEEVKKKTGEPANAHFTIMYGDLGKYRTVQEAVHNAEVQLTYAVGSVAIGAASNPAGYVAGVFGGFFWYGFGKSESAYDPLIIEMKSNILFDFDEDGEKATIYTVEGTGTLYNVNDESTLDVTTGHKVTVSQDGEFGPVTGFDESELNDDLRTILDYIGGEDVSVSLKKGLTFESRSKPAGSSVQIPLTLSGIEENIGNMDITLSYDPSVLEATDVIKGGLTTDSLFDYNIVDGTIKVSLADKQGFNGDGSIAYVNFDVIGSEVSSSDLEIEAITANRADDYETVEIQTHDGLFNVISMEEGMGDGDGDGVYTALDALYALQMAVEKIPEDPVMDVNEDGSVTSFDARKILRIATELETI